ncbi:MAG: transketolase [Clostridium sp.]|jgi:hypothetical protein|nr:transketolase [Clostridium sp.]
MNLTKSIDFLLENAGAVIQYRLHKEILHDLTPTEEENLLEKVYQTPYFQLVQSYAKPNGYIGSGAHSWDNWRGVKLHETPLQDGECAARLLSYYAIPKAHPLVRDFIAAMRDEETLWQEFSYIPPEIPRFENRFEGLNSGFCLMGLLYTMQAMLGYGDDYEDLRVFQQICLKGFRRILEVSSLDEITKFRPESKQKYNCPYIESDEYYPSVFSLAMLAYTDSWRTDANVQMLRDSLNHINKIMEPTANMAVKIKGKYVAVGLCALDHSLRAYSQDLSDVTLYRRPLTEMAMCGVGERVDVLRESVANLQEALSGDGILRITFDNAYKKKVYMSNIFPSSYGDITLETDNKRKWAVECDLTFWAVQFLKLMEGNNDGL